MTPAKKILFLDYDGVLHPDAAYLERGRPVLRAEGELFMWAGLLADVLADRPDVRIVLSTSWARHLGYSRARDSLPEPLRGRVIGATWHSGMRQGGWAYGGASWWDSATRHAQISRYVARAGVQDWLALDDDGFGWPEGEMHRLVQTFHPAGLSDPAGLALLAERLEVL